MNEYAIKMLEDNLPELISNSGDSRYTLEARKEFADKAVELQQAIDQLSTEGKVIASASVTNKIGNDIGDYCLKYAREHSIYSDGRKALLQDCEWYPLIADICEYINKLQIDK